MKSVPNESRYARFYSATGELLHTEEHHKAFRSMEAKLDPAAGKPQPANCRIQYWPAFPITFLGKVVATKGVPRDFIVFYDKHENTIKSYRYNQTQQVITSFDGTHHVDLAALDQVKDFPLDLTKVQYNKGG